MMLYEMTASVAWVFGLIAIASAFIGVYLPWAWAIMGISLVTGGTLSAFGWRE